MPIMTGDVNGRAAADQPELSVIIPTFNRRAAVARLLTSLGQQTHSHFEVILVDDGSTDETPSLAASPQPFRFTYLRQANQGPTAARNRGAAVAQGEVLIFVDDDMVLHPHALAVLAARCQQRSGILWMGTLIGPGELSTSSASAAADHPVDFTLCKTGLLAMLRADFYDIGQFQDPTGGWPNWDDVDFGYRAHLAGYAIWQCRAALAEHWDYAGQDLAAACARWQRASQAAVRLFERYPALQSRLPMFADKTPIAWRQDPLRLVARKWVRRLMSGGMALHGLETMQRRAAAARWPSSVQVALQRWIVGGYIYRGFQKGLQQARTVIVERATVQP
ncbi:MAG: glycosyltransferase family 2 protein [Anaerolineae bacterium]